MKKFLIVFLFAFLTSCSSGQNIVPPETPSTIQTPGLLPTRTAVLPTRTRTPASTFTPSVTSTAIEDGARKIAFTSEQAGVSEIYVVNSDGSNLIKLTNGITPKYNPAWSPDGQKIAFGTNTDNSASIYIMNTDGSNPSKLIDTKDIDVYDQATPDWRFVTDCCSPVWSPNGAKIAFSIFHYVGCCMLYSNIYIIDTDGINLISISDHPTEVSDPVWSPDSKKIIFGGDICGPWGICVINADGTNLINLTRKKGAGGPLWSPDGNKIVFAAGWGGNAEIYLMNADGTNPIRLTHTGSPWDHNPVWSPDGKRIAFISYRDGNYEIYAMNSDGTDLVNLTNNPADDGSPIWSPDSTKIAFVSERDGNAEIYITDADGGNLFRLTNNDARDYSPVWSP